MVRPTLRARIVLGLLGYTLLLSSLIITFEKITDEDEDAMIETSLLTPELDDFLQHRAVDGRYPLPRSSTLNTYLGTPGSSLAGVPAALRSLSPGLHAEIEVGDRYLTTLVRDVGTQRVYMTFDVTQQKNEERAMFGWALLFFVLGISVLSWTIWWLSGKLLRPVSDLAAAIDRVAPDEREQRIDVAENSSAEIATIAGAMNRYFERMDGFVLRERAFIDSVSHELRTPIAVIAGATEVMEADAALPESSRRPLARIRRLPRTSSN